MRGMSDALPYKHVIVVGVGLIGGSVALACQRRWPQCRVTGIGRRADRLQAAQDGKLLDDWAHSISDVTTEDAAIVVVCLPVSLIGAAVIEIAGATSEDVLITDAGSVKQSIQDDVQKSALAASRFVGAHPIAGSEQTGFEHGDAELFVDRPCIVTTSSAGEALEQRCQQFWQDLGSVVSVLDPIEHDRALARTSHLPHLMAAVTTNCVQPDDLRFSGKGFEDSTRVAAGHPQLWQQILCSNRTEVLKAIAQAEEELQELSAALRDDDVQAVTRFLDRAADLRRTL